MRVVGCFWVVLLAFLRGFCVTFGRFLGDFAGFFGGFRCVFGGFSRELSGFFWLFC